MARKANKLLCCHLSHEMTETLLTFQEQKDIPFSPSRRIRGKRRGKKKKRKSFSMTVYYSIFNSQPDFLISPVSPVTAQLVLVNWTQSQSPLEGVSVGRADPQHSTNCSTRATLPPPHTTAPEHILLCPS